jgi:hypothetical protein
MKAEAPFFGDMEVVLDAVGLEMTDAGADDGRDPAPRQEEDAHQRQFADALQRVGGDRLQQGNRLPLGEERGRVPRAIAVSPRAQELAA